MLSALFWQEIMQDLPSDLRVIAIDLRGFGGQDVRRREQGELIARALTSHRGGQAWVMRRRTQAEMDQLVEAAGFEKIEQRIDECGIFTVSLARRKA